MPKQKPWSREQALRYLNTSESPWLQRGAGIGVGGLGAALISDKLGGDAFINTLAGLGGAYLGDKLMRGDFYKASNFIDVLPPQPGTNLGGNHQGLYAPTVNRFMGHPVENIPNVTLPNPGGGVNVKGVPKGEGSNPWGAYNSSNSNSQAGRATSRGSSQGATSQGTGGVS